MSSEYQHCYYFLYQGRVTFPGLFVCLAIICVLSGRNQFMPLITLTYPGLATHSSCSLMFPGLTTLYLYLGFPVIWAQQSGVSVSVRCHHCCDGQQ